MESAEEHLVDIKADKDYLVESLRDPTYNLSLNKRDNNKPFLPIMPIFTPEILKDGDIDALYAYLLTLNPEGKQGPKIAWVSQAEKQYDLMKDTGAVIVTDRARIQRAPINGNSARTFFVGLPGECQLQF